MGQKLKIISLLVFCFVLPAYSQDVSPATTQVEIDKVMKKVYPALVRISVVFSYFEQGREKRWRRSGSGVIISPEGEGVTNHHVVGHASRRWCTLADKEEVEAELVGSDALCDIAVIKRKPVQEMINISLEDA